MRVRILQITDENDDQLEWYDDAYVYEDDQGQVVFRYNLAWDRVGSKINGQLQETGISLDEIETLIPANEDLRWLPVEEVADDQAEAYLEELDHRCAIPKPRSIADKLDQTLAA